MNDVQVSVEARARELLRAGTLTLAELAELRNLEVELGAARDPLARAVRERRRPEDVRRAIAILRGERATVPEMVELAKRLSEYTENGYARRLLAIARQGASRNEQPDVYARIFQEGARCTYMDPDLPAEWRLDQALAILGEAIDLAKATDPETLGIAGAIWKRKWEVDGQRRCLERSLLFYLKGYAQGAPEAVRGDVLGWLRADRSRQLDAHRDAGYCGINAAFVLDLIAHEEEAEALRLGIAASRAEERRAEATLIREEVIRSVPPLRECRDGSGRAREWWFYATVGEAYFGLQRYEDAIRWLTEEPARAGLQIAFDQTAPAGLDVSDWEYETTARQLARLARLQGVTDADDAFAASDAGRALSRFLQGDEVAMRTAFRGKFGLGLSGGGFRAALFHIGVLARLAESDLLRHVEVLSCVSGGSIVGAHYYLKLRQLLESKTDAAITAADYVGLVRELEAEFIAGVQRNIRTRVLAELTTNLKMVFWPGYSRTQRVGELYERELYARVRDGHPGGKRLLRELQIFPLDSAGRKQTNFHPRHHNWRRRNKVPILVLNAACLNTGHNWQFTASFMGEPPMPINADIDCNERLRRVYLKDAPPKLKDLRLGHAVAASSCVPGLFEPLVLDRLYEDRSVRLVDGGVCDNQGVSTLLEQDCTVLIVSDGSGQMEADKVPSRGIIGVPLRANSILQARVREAQYETICARRRSSLLRGLPFVHLKQGLRGSGVPWDMCPPEQRDSDLVPESRHRDRTDYGVDLGIQRRLAAVRTDLDSFSDAEAYALMASGYRMTADRLSGSLPDAGPIVKRGEWTFQQIAQELEPEGASRSELDRVLAASSNSAFKVWKLSRALVAVKWAIAGALVAAVLYAIVRWPAFSLVPAAVRDWARDNLTRGHLGAGAATLLGVAALAYVARAIAGRRWGGLVARVVRPRELVQGVAIGLAMCLGGFLLARIHLHVFDRLYLRIGRLARFRRAAETTTSPGTDVGRRGLPRVG